MMKKSYRRLTRVVILILAFVVCFGMEVAAYSNKIPNPIAGKYVYDNADILGGDLEKELNNLLIKLEEKTEYEFVIYSLPASGLPSNTSIEDYANILFNDWGIGQEGLDNGVLLIFSQKDNLVRIETGDGTASFLTDQKCGYILDTYFVPYRQKDNYRRAVKETANAILLEIEDETGIKVGGAEPIPLVSEEESKVPVFWIILILIGGIILFHAVSMSDDDDDDYGGGGTYIGGYYGGFHGSSSSGGGHSGGPGGGGHSSGGGATR